MIFRRINGHIVPIKENKSNEGKKAASLVAGGVAVASIAGAHAGNLDRSAALAKNEAKNEFAKRVFKAKTKVGAQKAFQLRSPHFKTAAKHRLESIRGHKAAQRIKVGGAAIGATLVGAGVHKALSGNKKISEDQKGAIATGAGIASYVAARSFHVKQFAGSGLWGAFKHAIKRVSVRGFKL